MADLLYKIEFRKKTNMFIAIFLGLWILAWLGITGSIVYGLIVKWTGDFALILVLCLLIGLVIVDLFLWQVNGVEVLLITDKIEIIKKGKLFKASKQIEFSEYESVDFGYDLSTPVFARWYGISGGNLKIEYVGRSTKFGQDIPIELAQIVADEIDREIRMIMFT